MSADSDMEYSDNDCEYDDYYNSGEDCDVERLDPKKTDPEYFEFVCLTVEEVEKLLNESVEKLNTILEITPSLAKVLLLEHQWDNQVVVDKYRKDANALLITARIKPPNPFLSIPDPLAPSTSKDAVVFGTSSSVSRSSSCSNDDSPPNALISLGICNTYNTVTPGGGMISQRCQMCPVCASSQMGDKFFSLSCGHAFCKDCWSTFFDTQIFQGISTQIGCMAPMCNVRVPEDLVLTLVTRPVMRDKYQQFAFKDYVKSHPQLRFCPGPNCQIIVRSPEVCAKRVICTSCHTSFCFKCGMDYHAPTDCVVIKKWLTKCADDSETANYISANTKDCPKCHICIEKNGGCNHMLCFNCKHDFCWMCLGDWKTHGSEYYECSRYKDNPNIANESVHVQAREALKKYLHYYERWENHSKSLQLEQQTIDRLRDRINEKVMKGRGTWIDWQYLFNAAALLAKCRYTLQYTYPYAYFMESGSRKDLFEYQQAQLEAEIENLSWKIERAETTDLGDLENQMDIAEKRRTTLLKDFFPVDF
ncbi:potential E3 ubiquitin-protein ligase ariadne-2 [Bactrocera neohumeralis]|uniref:potential E3 ubiquitin-protein ligase ariadne-2 n=1 Tax=Bactrocera tryoni TaxID=59916 RepID=UPI001A973FBF|nr:potential E3 ubiquitin-protein ligase ariadne-2 [Bactrocera tryoni]XP_050324813.1 potential E3 ubiquitin-protein ligase ariadne-2 [Bactrocera neohumeralis]